MLEHVIQSACAIVVGAHDGATHFDTQVKKHTTILSSSGDANHIVQCLLPIHVPLHILSLLCACYTYYHCCAHVTHTIIAVRM